MVGSRSNSLTPVLLILLIITVVVVAVGVMTEAMTDRLWLQTPLGRLMKWNSVVVDMMLVAVAAEEEDMIVEDRDFQVALELGREDQGCRVDPEHLDSNVGLNSCYEVFLSAGVKQELLHIHSTLSRMREIVAGCGGSVTTISLRCASCLSFSD